MKDPWRQARPIRSKLGTIDTTGSLLFDSSNRHWFQTYLSSLDLDCPPRLTRGLIANLNTETGSNPTTKIGNRHIAVEARAAEMRAHARSVPATMMGRIARTDGGWPELNCNVLIIPSEMTNTVGFPLD
ncbi:hypothetical protein SDJN03_01430, partial [Cucurbita argyrosperma subsp. sororia]